MAVRGDFQLAITTLITVHKINVMCPKFDSNLPQNSTPQLYFYHQEVHFIEVKNRLTP